MIKSAITIKSLEISVSISTYGLHFEIDETFYKLMQPLTYVTLLELVTKAKELFENQHHRPLQISSKSLIIEVLAHFYFVKWFSPLQKKWPKNKILNKLIRKSSLIDCGEWSHDGNRPLWDILSPFVFILKMLK